MKYVIMKSCIIKGKRYGAQEVVDLDDDTAKVLKGIGRISPVGDAPKKAEKEEKSDRSVGLEKSETKPKTRAKAKAKPAKSD